MKIVARLSQKHRKVVVAEMTKPGTKAKKAKSKKKCHCREAHCRPSPTSCTLKPIATPKAPHYHTQITHYECFLILITSGKKRAKATSHLSVSIDGQHSKVLQKPKAMRYAFLPKRTGLSKNISDNCLTHVTRLPRQGWRHRAITCPWKPMWTRPQPPFPTLHPSTQKAASRTAKKANAQGG